MNHANAFAYCDCHSGRLIQTEVVYSIPAEGYVCATCEHYPVYINEASAKTSEGIDWRREVSDDLRDLLNTWYVPEEDDFDASTYTRLSGGYSA